MAKDIYKFTVSLGEDIPPFQAEGSCNFLEGVLSIAQLLFLKRHEGYQIYPMLEFDTKYPEFRQSYADGIEHEFLGETFSWTIPTDRTLPFYELRGSDLSGYGTRRAERMMDRYVFVHDLQAEEFFAGVKALCDHVKMPMPKYKRISKDEHIRRLDDLFTQQEAKDQEHKSLEKSDVVIA